jgi:iron complex outermembrane receptor protein
LGERLSSYNITNTSSFGVLPANATLNLADIFAQDTITLADTVKLTVGMKIEDEAYTGLEPLPSVRLSWKPIESTLLWSAVSRAVRAPTPFDRDLFENSGPITVLKGDSNFRSETLTAYELGTRVQPTSALSFSISTYYNVYDDLRSIEYAPGGTILPLQFGNMMEGDSYGTEVWGAYKLTDWWRLAAGANWLHENLRFKAGSSGLGGIAQAGDDPKYQFSLRSSFDLSRDVTFDTTLRGVGALPNPSVPAYKELDARLGWKVTEHLLLSLNGNNLIHPKHLEFNASTPVEIPRSFYLSAQWRF